jgi:hypothetical protein
LAKVDPVKFATSELETGNHRFDFLGSIYSIQLTVFNNSNGYKGNILKVKVQNKIGCNFIRVKLTFIDSSSSSGIVVFTGAGSGAGNGGGGGEGVADFSEA